MLRHFYNIIQLPFGYAALRAFQRLEEAMRAWIEWEGERKERHELEVELIEAWRNFLNTVKG